MKEPAIRLVIAAYTNIPVISLSLEKKFGLVRQLFRHESRKYIYKNSKTHWMILSKYDQETFAIYSKLGV